MNSLKKFIRTLQTSDEATKKRFVFISSALCMVLLVILWVFYLNATLPNEGEGGTTNATLEQGSLVQAGTSHWQTFKRGISIISDKFASEKGVLATYSNEIMEKINKIGENENVSENQNTDKTPQNTSEEFEPLFKNKETPPTQQQNATATIPSTHTTTGTEEILFPTE